MTDTVESAHVARPEVDELRTSARGWHGVQLAVLGFIGLCGALQSGSAGSGPGWLQRLAAALVLAALVVACLATVLVASEAWPVSAGRRPGPGNAGPPDGRADTAVRRGGRHLRTGIALTFLAVVLVALATSTSWWPKADRTSDLVEVSTAQGTFCGVLAASDGASVALDVAGRSIVLPVDQVAGLRPVASCSGG
jgi:hypothetical protein